MANIGTVHVTITMDYAVVALSKIRDLADGKAVHYEDRQRMMSIAYIAQEALAKCLAEVAAPERKIFSIPAAPEDQITPEMRDLAASIEAGEPLMPVFRKRGELGCPACESMRRGEKPTEPHLLSMTVGCPECGDKVTASCGGKGQCRCGKTEIGFSPPAEATLSPEPPKRGREFL